MFIRKDENRPLEFRIELLRIGSAEYNAILPLLKNKVGKLKFYGYF